MEISELFGFDTQSNASVNDHQPFTEAEFDIVITTFTSDLEAVAPDLKSKGLAHKYSTSLFNKLNARGTSSIKELRELGSEEYFQIGRRVLGPLAVSFVHTALKHSDGIVIFPARDATPLYCIAKTLTQLNPTSYQVPSKNILNPVFNRKLWGVEDEQDLENNVLPLTHPLVQRLLSQLGFGTPLAKNFIEIGCWGTMVDQLKRTMPNEHYSVRFLFSHMPDKIYGFINSHGRNIPNSLLETFADTWEAFPKFYKRPTVLLEQDENIVASLDGKLVHSPFLQVWTNAALRGVIAAAEDFINSGEQINVYDELIKLGDLSEKARSGTFTGVLPEHTETWSEGPQWIANWPWGKIPPLQ